MNKIAKLNGVQKKFELTPHFWHSALRTQNNV
jgi:hypothetical protein